MRQDAIRAGAASVAIRDLPACARFSLRAGAEARAVVEMMIGLALPERIGERQVGTARSVLCLGPDEWVIHAPEEDGQALRASFASAAAAAPLSLVDIADREIALALEGPATLDLLACFCPRDPSVLPVGGGARTVLDTVEVVLVREAEDRFRLDVPRSFAPHLRALFAIAVREIETGL